MPTDARKVLATDGSDPQLETLMFQYGRYLLVLLLPPRLAAGQFAGPVERQQ